MNASAGDVAFQIGWMFFAYGPQLAICLWLAWSAARRAHGDRLNWLVVGFLWSLIPLAGVAIMWWLRHRAGRRAAGDSSGTAGGSNATA